MATFAETQLAKIEALLSANVGVQSVSIDGQSVTYDNLLKQRDYFKREVERQAGRRPAAASIQLDGF